MLCAAAWGWDVGELSATEVLLKDGRVLPGSSGSTTGLADLNLLEPNPNKDKAIEFIDDDLRRTFYSKLQVMNRHPDVNGQVPEKFRLRLKANRTGPKVVTVGPFIHVTSFDEYGTAPSPCTQRVGRSPSSKASPITPEWTKVEGITYMWDMRIATSSIPRDILHTILMKQIKDPKDIDQHKKVAQIFTCNAGNSGMCVAETGIHDCGVPPRHPGAAGVGPVDQGDAGSSTRSRCCGNSGCRRDPGAARVRPAAAEEVPFRRRAGRNPPGGPGRSSRNMKPCRPAATR